MSATWAEFEAAMPDMATVGRTLLHQYGGIGLGMLATTRKDGGPRVHQVCPHVVADGLWVFITPRSPKRFDLERDGRYALQTFPCEDRDDSFYCTGPAVRFDDAAVRAAVEPEFKSRVEPEEILFRLDVERALLSVYGPRPSGPPRQTTWRASS
jgi:hypothetical protein